MRKTLACRIQREQPIRRELRLLPTSAFLGLMREAQEHYVRADAPPAWLDETEFFWITQRSEVGSSASSPNQPLCVQGCSNGSSQSPTLQSMTATPTPSPYPYHSSSLVATVHDGSLIVLGGHSS